MQHVGIRDLHAQTSALIRRAAGGESLVVTDHGKPVARIVPFEYPSRLAQLIAEGKASPPEGSGDILAFTPPPPAPGEVPVSVILAEMRESER